MSNLNDAKAEAKRRGVGSYERHILLCIGPDCCSEKEGAAAWAHLKKRVAQLNGSGDAGRIYRTKVGCLRVCKDGPVAVVYPEGTWYAGLTPKNLDRVIDNDLAEGEVVAELRIGSNPLGGAVPKE
ncbi:MAG: (2Fe-2S) ferredoxin domain-containing protein [Dehalococcoidia bacterium]